MSNRHLARSIAMQCLYQWDFDNQNSAVLDKITEQSIKEFGIEEIEVIQSDQVSKNVHRNKKPKQPTNRRENRNNNNQNRRRRKNNSNKDPRKE